MEVKFIGQGGQQPLDINKNVEKTLQASGRQYLEKTNSTVDKNTAVKEMNEKELKNAVEKLNKFLEDNKTRAEYEFHDKFSNDLMIKIVDERTGEVIQELPPKKILDMVAKMMEMVGLLFDKKA